MWGHLQFAHEALKRTMPNRTTLNSTMWSHTKCDAKSSYVISTLLRYYAVLGGNSFPMFWEKPIGPIFKGQEIQKRKQGTTEVNWNNLPFWGDLSII